MDEMSIVGEGADVEQTKLTLVLLLKSGALADLARRANTLWSTERSVFLGGR